MCRPFSAVGAGSAVWAEGQVWRGALCTRHRRPQGVCGGVQVSVSYYLKGFISGFGEFIHVYNRRCPSEDKVRYLLVPEMHKDGAWHMHGFLRGIRESDLYVNQNGYLSWRQYEQKFGFMSMARIKGDRGIEKLCSYAMKYMSKEIGSSVTALGSHLYYCSKGLQTAQLVYKGRADLHCDWDWVHPDGFCKVKTFDDREDADISEFLEVLS